MFQNLMAKQLEPKQEQDMGCNSPPSLELNKSVECIVERDREHCHTRSTLTAMASNLVAKASNLDGLQPRSDFLQANSNGLQP